jgi:hypothetical protein
MNVFKRLLYIVFYIAPWLTHSKLGKQLGAWFPTPLPLLYTPLSQNIKGLSISKHARDEGLGILILGSFLACKPSRKSFD